MSEVKIIKEPVNKVRLWIHSILGFIMILVVLWVIVTNLVYSYINHDKTNFERNANWWYAVTCQWNRNFWEE